ncbi:MAG TPA: GNAT family N-acetyltransferase [Opitutaceae bacterium]|jgi:RimJ/RimL family protein N-acetyltransferase
MFQVDPAVVLEGRGIRLEPMGREHAPDLEAAAADGQLWTLTFTSVPDPGRALAYIETALADRDRGTRVPWVVRELQSGRIIGSTSYHDIIPACRRVEIGYTWYGRSWWRSHVNTACKLRLLEHAFDTLGCSVVGWRTDNLNLRSQAAIERLGARKDGVIRRAFQRRDGTLRDTVMYSVTSEEWESSIRSRLESMLR